jgi:hypothetical protein
MKLKYIGTKESYLRRQNMSMKLVPGQILELEGKDKERFKDRIGVDFKEVKAKKSKKVK